MADDISLPGLAVISTDEIGGVHTQRVKMQVGADGTASDVHAGNPLPTLERQGANAARSQRVEIVDTQVVPAGSRIAIYIYNDADKDYLLGAGSAAVTANDFTFRLKPGDIAIINDSTAEWRGLFVSAPTGKLMVTEVT